MTLAAHAIQRDPDAGRELDDLTLARAQRGEGAALRALVECYQDRVVGYLTRMFAAAPGDATVEDVAQDTFVRVLRALPGFDAGGRARLSTWILTIATRRAIDELRRRRPRAPVRDTTLSTPASHPLTGAVYRAVAALTADQRAAFLLQSLYGWTHAEIAVACGVEPGTVKSRIARARAALRAALEDDHG